MKTIYKKLLYLLLLLPFGVLAQSTLQGTVVDKASKQPVPGVNVVVQGTASGTQTDFDGKFQLENLKKGDVIVFSYLGYKNSTVTYNLQNNIAVDLAEDANELNEVVVVGYGSVKKKDATGAVTLVTAKDFNKGPVISADQLLTGKAPGVRIVNSGGQPDSTLNIRIRGGSSLSASNNPLIIIDGVPINSVNPAGLSNPLNLINPNDIESFSILKDASATAIYGSRASNGVIIITTKKGSSGAPQFNFSSSIAVGSLSKNKKIKMMDGPTYANFIRTNYPQLTYRLGIDDPGTPGLSDPNEDNPNTPEIEGRILSDTDWQDAIYQKSYTSDNNFSARANLFKKIPFRASVGYLKTNGLVKTNEYERVSGSIKMTPMLLDDHLKIDVNIKGFRSEKNAIDEGAVFGSALNMDPTKPIYGESPNNRFGGYYQNYLLTGGQYIKQGDDNPVAILNQRTRPEIVNKVLANAEFDYKLHFFPDLRAVVNVGLEGSRSTIEEAFSENSLQTYRFIQGNNDPEANYVFNPGVNYREDQHVTNKTLEAYFAYNKVLKGFVSRVDAQAGYSYQNFVNDGFKAIYAYDQNSGLRYLKPDKQTNLNNRYYNALNLQSFFGRANIDLLDKYLFTFTLRADASSFFKKENRWGYFPAAGFAWKITDESFLKDSNTFKQLKLRLGYGITGQQNISDVAGTFYPTTALFNAGQATSQYLPGVQTYSALPFDDSLTWEKTVTYNVGLDFEFFKNSLLSGSVDVYDRETKDLLAKRPGFPGQSLTNEFPANGGTLSNKGVELNLNLKAVATTNFNWDLNGNISYNKGEVTDLGTITEFFDQDSGLPTGTGVKIARNKVGYQPYSAWVFEQIYDGNGKPVQGAYVDRNGDGQINNDDRYNVAMRPNWTFGFGTSVNYKNLDLSASFRGQIGGKVYNSRNLVANYSDRVIPINTTSMSNILDGDKDFTNIQGNIPFSDYFLENASFLRCENITLGYKFPTSAKSTTLRFFVAANNLFIVTKYSGQDPENFNAIDNNFYPRPTVYSLGVNLDF